MYMYILSAIESIHIYTFRSRIKTGSVDVVPDFFNVRQSKSRGCTW